jgi:hypothetical protein
MKGNKKKKSNPNQKMRSSVQEERIPDSKAKFRSKDQMLIESRRFQRVRPSLG